MLYNLIFFKRVFGFSFDDNGVVVSSMGNPGPWAIIERSYSKTKPTKQALQEKKIRTNSILLKSIVNQTHGPPSKF